MSKSHRRPPVLKVMRPKAGTGGLPPYIRLGHRSLEKGCPPPTRQLGSKLVSYNIPVDHMRLAGIPANLVEPIESLEITYRRP